MKPLLRKIFFWDEPAQGAFFGLTSFLLCILLLTGCVSEYARIDSAILQPTLASNVYCDAGKHETSIHGGDFLTRTYAVTYVYGGNKEQVADFGRKIQAVFALNERENTNRFPFESGHLFFQVDNVTEVKRPENNHSIGQFCVKISIVPNLSQG